MDTALKLVAMFFSSIAFGALTVGPAYYISRDKLSFLSFSAFPVGVLVAWLLPCVALFLYAEKADSISALHSFLVLFFVIATIGSAYLGVFFFRENVTVAQRFWWGVKCMMGVSTLLTAGMFFLMTGRA